MEFSSKSSRGEHRVLVCGLGVLSGVMSGERAGEQREKGKGKKAGRGEVCESSQILSLKIHVALKR